MTRRALDAPIDFLSKIVIDKYSQLKEHTSTSTYY